MKWSGYEFAFYGRLRFMNVFKRAEQRFEDWLVEQKKAAYTAEIENYIRVMSDELNSIGDNWSLTGVSVTREKWDDVKINIDKIHSFMRHAPHNIRLCIERLERLRDVCREVDTPPDSAPGD
jgi:hypothetical protein